MKNVNQLSANHHLFNFFTTCIVTVLVALTATSFANECATDVGWTSPDVHTVISNGGIGTTVTKSSGGNGWVSGAYDLHPVGPGGFVQFQAGETNTYKMIGLNSDPATDHSYCSIDYAWYPNLDGTTYIYESCNSRGGFGGAYSSTDVFRVYWNPSNNRIEYLKNGAVQYTSSVVPSGTLYVDISLYTQGASLTNVIVQGGKCDMPFATTIVWAGLDDGTAKTGTSISKTGGTANSWSSGGYSLQPVNAGGFVQFQAVETNTYKMLGLNSDPATDHSYCSLDYAWYPHASGSTNIYESCTSRGGFGGAYSTSDVFMIYWNPSNNRIEYLKNGAVQYTSTIIPSGTYYVDISLYTSGAGFKNVIVARSVRDPF